MDFEEALRDLGFGLTQDKGHVRYFSASPNPYLTYTVHAFDDGTALFTWEFAIGEYVATKQLQIGSDEHLNTFLFPREDARGPQDAAWLAGEIDRAESSLRSLSFLDAD